MSPAVTIPWFMPDDSQLHRQVLLRLAGSPWVLAPAVVGATAGIGVWAMDAQIALGAFALCAGVLGSIGALFTKALLGGSDLRAAVERELVENERSHRESILDQLDRNLASLDRDSRPEAALRDLRALQSSFEQLATRPNGSQSLLSIEVISQVRRLSERSIDSLRQTIDLQQTVSRLNTASAAAPLLAERERLIREVQISVQQLGQALATLQTLGPDSAAPELHRLRGELDASLDAARRAEVRLEQMLAPPARESTSAAP